MGRTEIQREPCRPPRVLLVSTNRERSPQPVMPIGVATVASTLASKGIEVAVKDLCFVRDPIRALGRSVRRFQPDYVGLSVRNLDNADSLRPTWYLSEVKALVETIRNATAAPIVLGGSAVGVSPSAIMAYVGADYAVIGDGEEGLSGLLEALENDGSVEKVPGIVYRRDKAIVNTPPSQKSQPHINPHLERWVEVERYLRAGATVPIQTKRGCSFRCTYCTYRTIEGAQYRLREPDSVIEEVEHLWRTTGARDFEFVDSTFNNPLPHALAICESIVARKLPFRFHSGSLTPANCTEELLALMARGRFSTVVTAESASDPVLRSMAKGYTADQVYKAAGALRTVRLPALWIFLVGGPGETDRTLKETLHFIAEEIRDQDVAYITWGVRVYPGTPLEERFRASGSVEERDDLLRPTFYVSPALDAERAVAELETFAHRHRNVITATASQHWLIPHLMRLAGALRVPHPHWRFVPWMNAVRVGLAGGPPPRMLRSHHAA